MAKLTRIKKKKQEWVPAYTLELSEYEARTIATILGGHTGGEPVNSLYNVFYNNGVDGVVSDPYEETTPHLNAKALKELENYR